MLVMQPIKNNSSSQSFGNATFKFESQLQEKVGDVIFKNVPSNKGLMKEYLQNNGTFNIDLFVKHLKGLVQEEPGFDGTYVVSSVRKLRGKNVHLATVKHFDEAGKEIKGDEFKFNPLNSFFGNFFFIASGDRILLLLLGSAHGRHQQYKNPN